MSVVDTHWAFVPVIKPEVPEVSASVRHTPVDAFIISQLEAHGLNLNEPVGKRSLIRRVTYDLTGLPPEYEDVQAFINDDSPTAYADLVERLLASPAYGERWARHWLDVARYADTKGIFRRGRYAFSHTYRDYVIRAFNEDKPYDRFILEQIAADQLDLKEGDTSLAAMGFLTLGRTFFGRKHFIIDDQIDVITRGLQGLTVTCARCHDHKFDPIPIADYYSLHGIFASSQDAEDLPVIQPPRDDSRHGDYLEEKRRIEREIANVENEVIDTFLMEERSLAGGYLAAADEGRTLEDEDAFTVFSGSKGLNADILCLWIDFLDTEAGRAHPALEQWFREFEGLDEETGIAFYNERFAAAATGEGDAYPEILEFFQENGSPLNPDRDDVAVWIRRRIGGKTGDLSGELMALDWTHPGAPFRAHILEDVEEPANSPVFKRGNPNNPGEKVPRRYLQVLGGFDRPFSVGSGRLELAREIASENNPLTARVFVNRVWGWHMGKELVDTPSDFGIRTPEPLHIDLLSWLAASFMESGWSIKELHRWIVLSRTYRQSSEPDPEALMSDSENSLWHYVPRMRLDFESMRDTLLKVSGNLDTTMGGIQDDLTDPTTNRRTVYSFIDRRDMPGIFRTFDHPSPEATSPGRFETVVPQQALFLMNSPFVINQAKMLVSRIVDAAGDDFEARVREAYRFVYQREATPEEVRTGLQFVRNAETEADDSGDADKPQLLSAWELYAQALLLSNELIFLD